MRWVVIKKCLFLIGIVATILTVVYGVKRALDTYLWTRESIAMGRDAYVALAAPVAIDGQTYLLMKGPDGKDMRVPLAEMMRFLASERGKQLTEQAKQAEAAKKAN